MKKRSKLLNPRAAAWCCSPEFSEAARLCIAAAIYCHCTKWCMGVAVVAVVAAAAAAAVPVVLVVLVTAVVVGYY